VVRPGSDTLNKVLLAATAVVVGAPPAAAHVAPVGSDTLLAQTIAGMEITVAVRRTGQVPGPLRVDLIPHTPVRDLPIEVTVRSVTSTAVAAGTARLERDVARTYPVGLAVNETGPHWLELSAAGEQSQLPFRVDVQRAPDTDNWVSGLFAAAALLLVAALVAGAWGPRPLPLVLSGAGGAAFVAGITVALLSPMLVPTVGQTTAVGRSYAQAKIATVPEHPAAGVDFTLHVTLVDGATGQPLDDLVPHHQALAHVIVTSADRVEFHHLHPRRTAAGQLQVRLSAARPGSYQVDVEFEREGSGTQLVSGGLTVAGSAVATAAKPLAVLPTTTPNVVATRPVGIAVDTGPGRVQPWLGMAGHMIVRDGQGSFLGHAHEMGSMAATAAPDDTVPTYSPKLRFAFTFPEPGRYFVWVQYSRQLTIVTVPYQIDIQAVEP
jgi:hypothetical protein